MKNIFFSLCFFTCYGFAQDAITDIDGNTYDYLNYGTEQWTVENAAMETYRDGTPIPQVTSQSAWTNLTTGAWCYANNNSANTKLYNWYAVAGIHDNDPNTSNKELAPEGWHIPTDAEWTNLEEFLIANGYNYDGSSTGNKIAKAMASTTGWSNSAALGVPGNTQASNNSTNLAFEASGYRHGLNGIYTGQNQSANFWASDQSTFQNPDHPVEFYSWVRTLKNNESDLIRYENEAKDGFSVRFIKNSDNCSAPTGPLTQAFCDIAIVSDLTATGDNIHWYDAATDGNLLDSSTPLTDGQIVYASQTVDGCESTDRLEVTVSIQEITITASATEVCAGESVDLSVISSFSTIDVEYFNWDDNEPNDTGTGNENVVHIQPWGKWNDTYCFNCSESYSTNAIFELNYEVSELGNLIFLGNYNSHSYFYANQSLTWPEANQMAESYNTYLLNINTAEENEFIVNSVNNLGLVLNAWLGMIQDENDELYSEPSGGWKWLNTNYLNPEDYSYLWSTGDTTENITVTPTETTEYWVDVTTNGVTCRKYITINVTAPAPTGNAVGEACSDLTVGTNNNSFNGENILWYDSIDSQTPLSDDTLLVDGTTYYISQTVDGCESIDRFEILILAPLPIITIDNSIICEGESTNVSVSTNPFLGTVTYLWNSDENETSDFIITAPTESSGGWVDVSLIYEYEGGIVQNLCRYFYSITVQEAPEPPVIGGDITECETIVAQNLEATASVSTGQTIVWYDAASGGNVVTDPSLSAAGTATYYAETINDDSGCSSLSRTSVTLTITSIAAPTGDAVQSFCDVSTIADLTVTGDAIQWYDSATGGILLDNTTAFIDGQLVYASQTEDGCESITRLEVSVEIDIIPDPILLTTELDFCLAREATLADLEIDAQGFELEWYDSYTGGALLGLDTILEDAISYYATLYDVVSGCESLMRFEVIPTVIPCEVIIYNAISINDNGLNDYMVIENAEYFPFNTLEIFNRDGYLVYNQRKYGVGDNLFRGMANVGGIYSQGSNLPTGSYLYVFTYYNPYEQQEFVKKGFLTINNN